MPHRRTTRRLLAAAGLALLLAPAAAAAADPQDPDWPCIQRKVPEVSAAAIWAGPPLDEAARQWRDDAEVARLVGELSARSLPLDQARGKLEAFADGLAAERNARLTRLFAGLLQTINRERSSIMAGIERFARKQRALAERIEQTGSRIDTLAAAGEASGSAELEEQQAWDARIYHDREQSLKYLCQQPIDLEQRLFEFARTIAAKLE